MDLNRVCWYYTAFLGTGIHTALHKMPSTCLFFASPLNIQVACSKSVHREVIDSVPLESASFWDSLPCDVSMAFCSNTEEAVPTF